MRKSNGIACNELGDMDARPQRRSDQRSADQAEPGLRQGREDLAAKCHFLGQRTADRDAGGDQSDRKRVATQPP